MKEKKKSKRGLLVLLIPGLFLFVSCKEQNIQPVGAKALPVETVNVRVKAVTSGNIEKHVQLSGEVFATDIVSITPETAGFLTQILVEPGDSVSAGQIIATVDPSRPGMSFAESPVRSKTAGTVTHVPAIAGNKVSPQVVIAEVGNLDNLEIKSKIPERYLASLRLDLQARITSRAYPDEIITARISKISPVVDPRSRTVLTTLSPETSKMIRPGQSVMVDLILETHRDVLLIPNSAITERNSEQGVFVIRGGESHWRKILAGLGQAGMTEVLEGLEKGDEIAVAGVDELTDRIPVKVLD